MFHLNGAGDMPVDSAILERVMKLQESQRQLRVDIQDFRARLKALRTTANRKPPRRAGSHTGLRVAAAG